MVGAVRGYKHIVRPRRSPLDPTARHQVNLLCGRAWLAALVIPPSNAFLISMGTKRRASPTCCATEDTVTREGFSETLRELRADLAQQPDALSKGQQRGLSADQIACESLMCTRFTSGLEAEGFCRVYLAPSSIPGAGAGVFASEDFEEGDILTFYPGDILTFSRHPRRSSRRAKTRSVIWGAHVPTELQLDNPSKWVDYEVGISDVYTIMGHPWLLDEMAYVGHMVNDGAMLESCAGGDAAGKSAASAYIASSEKLANAAHVDLAGCHAAVIATRVVKADEELFVTYGVEYWASREIRIGELAAAGPPAAGVPSVRATSRAAKPSSIKGFGVAGRRSSGAAKKKKPKKR